LTKWCQKYYQKIDFFKKNCLETFTYIWVVDLEYIDFLEYIIQEVKAKGPISTKNLDFWKSLDLEISRIFGNL